MTSNPDGEVLQPLEALLDRFDLANPAAHTEEGHLHSMGPVGYIGYDFAPRLERLPRHAEPDSRMADLRFALYDTVVTVDHATGAVDLWARTTFSARGMRPERVGSSFGGASLSRLRLGLGRGIPRLDRCEVMLHGRRISRRSAGYSSTSRREMSFRSIFPSDSSARKPEPLDLYLRLMRRSPAPFAAYLRVGRPGRHQARARSGFTRRAATA